MDNEVYLIKECWMDEYRTLMQCISYLPNDERDKYKARDLLNPNMTVLVRTEKLNREFKIIEEEHEEEQNEYNDNFIII